MTLAILMRKRNSDQKKEEVLLCIDGLGFDIKTGKKENTYFTKTVQNYFASFQINRKLFFCGGEAEINGKEEKIADFFSVDYFGKSVELQPMN